MKKMKIIQRDYIKANRKASREAEIENHMHPVTFNRIHKSKKIYDRNKIKAGDKGLPYLFLLPNNDILIFSQDKHKSFKSSLFS